MPNRSLRIGGSLVCCVILLAACASRPTQQTTHKTAPPVAASAPAAAASAPADAQHAAAPGAQASAPAAAPAVPPNLKPYAEVAKGFTRLAGYLTVYHKDERYMVALKPEDFSKPFLFTTTFTRGIGERGLWGGTTLESGVGAFIRLSDRVQWVERNTTFIAPNNKPLQYALQDGFSDSLRGVAPILSQPDPQTQAVLVDLNAMLLTDFSATATRLQAIYHQPYQLDRNNSVIQQAQNSAQQTRIHITAHYMAPALAVPAPNQPVQPAVPSTLPDPRSMFLGFQIDFASLPQAAPTRMADPRVGYFLTRQLNFDNDLSAHNQDFLIHRWRLEKQDPEAKLSPPKTPIVYWLDRNIPERYRDTVKRGILVWNEAFERIGIKNAIEVKQAPDSPDPADKDAAPHHAIVQWFLGTDNSLAIGQSQVDPRTGEIIAANIVISDAWTRLPRASFVRDVHHAHTDRQAHDDEDDCDFATDAYNEMQQSLDVLEARGEIAPDSPEAEAFVQDTLFSVVMHEVGHTLGLRHNFRASSAYSLAQLRDPAFVAQNGIAASIMDYTADNVPPKHEPTTAYVQKVLGPYDYWAIEYGYAILPKEAEAAGLRSIAEQASSNPYLAYATDEDAGETGGLSSGIDPAVARFDLGNDPVAWFRLRLQLSRELWDSLAQRPLSGKPFEAADMRISVERSLRLLAMAANNATRNIGGVSVIRHTSAQQQEAFVPVPASTQRNTLAALSAGFFQPDSFKLNADLLRRLAPSPLEYSSLEPQLPLMGLIQQMQAGVLDQLFSDRVTTRLLEAELSAPAKTRFPLAELYARLRHDIWQELDHKAEIPLLRRNLQRAYLTRLCKQILQANGSTPSDARALARREAQSLRTAIGRALNRSHTGAETQAHLRESLATLDEALRAPVLRQTP